MALYPSSAAADANLFVAANNVQTTLNGAINSSTTTVVLTDASSLPSAGYVTIGLEAIKYTGKSTNTLTGVTRGADGTTAASHADGSLAFHNVVAAHHNVLKDEIKAIETDLVSQQAGLNDGATIAASAADLKTRLDQIATQIKKMSGTGFSSTQPRLTKLSGDIWLNPRDAAYGAVGDGTTSDQAAFEACFAAATAGSIIFIPAGTYKLTNSIIIGANKVTVIGVGRGTVLKFVHATSNPFGLSASDKTDIVIKDLNITGGDMVFDQAARGGITFAGGVFGVIRGLVDNVHILNWQGTGVLLTGCEQVTVRNCYIYRSYEHSMYLAGAYGSGQNLIDGVFIEESGYNSGTSHFGMKVSSFKKCKIVNCHFKSPTNRAIQFEADNSETLVHGCTFYSDNAACDRVISYAGSCEMGELSKPVIHLTQAVVGIYLGGGTRIRITDPEIVLPSNAASIGIDVDYAMVNSSIIGGNIRGGGAGYAIAFQNVVATNNLVTHMIIQDFSGGTGVYLGAATTGNLVKRNIFANVTTKINDTGTNTTDATLS